MNAMAEIERIDDPATVEATVNRLRAVRGAVGDEVDIGVDFHGRITKPMIKRLAKAPEPYEPMFIEEPAFPDQNDVLPQVATHTIRDSLGENTSLRRLATTVGTRRTSGA